MLGRDAVRAGELAAWGEAVFTDVRVRTALVKLGEDPSPDLLSGVWLPPWKAHRLRPPRSAGAGRAVSGSARRLRRWFAGRADLRQCGFPGGWSWGMDEPAATGPRSAGNQWRRLAAGVVRVGAPRSKEATAVDALAGRPKLRPPAAAGHRVEQQLRVGMIRLAHHLV